MTERDRIIANLSDDELIGFARMPLVYRQDESPVMLARIAAAYAREAAKAASRVEKQVAEAARWEGAKTIWSGRRQAILFRGRAWESFDAASKTTGIGWRQVRREAKIISYEEFLERWRLDRWMHLNTKSATRSATCACGP